jgi:hypothetical protein
MRRLSILIVLLVTAGLAGVLRARGAADDDAPLADTSATEVQRGPAATSTVLDAETTCRNVGYLCADLANADRIHLRRWKDFSGTIVVHVPRPDFESGADAMRLQEAAARGLRAWNGQPFQILTDLQGDRTAHFAVAWSRDLGGNQIGVARTQWSSRTGLTVVAIELSTRSPFAATRVNDPRQVQLTAAHEMGHALGLPHSDAERDVMFPSNTATSLSAQDYRTMESLYQLEDGTEIVRR